nr:PAS domain-containing protein [Glaciimonas sp. PCH181]
MDVTDRVCLDPEQTRFRNAMDVIAQGVCLLDPVGMRLIDVNETICSMFAYTREALFALDLADFGIGSIQQLRSIYDALTAGNTVPSQTTDLRRGDGTTLAVSIDWRPLPVNDSGIIVGVISIRNY